MDPTMLTEHLAREYALLDAAITAADPDAPVPTCPGWTAADLARHITTVYIHKAESMRLDAFPDPWPPDEVGTLADAYAALLAQFVVRDPADPTPTWFDPDQTVGFWVRRMAQETSIHRIDAELAAGRPVTPIAPDLAADGVDEVLGWIVYAPVAWREDFPMLDTADTRPLELSADGHVWTVKASPDGVRVEPGRGAGTPAATVSGTPDALCRWMWGRGGAITVDGDEALAAQLLTIIAPVVQ
jgi:uncharacterized protein (TIGR03083 family)